MHIISLFTELSSPFQLLILYSFVGTLILLLVLLVMLARARARTRRANRALTHRNQETKAQKQTLEELHKVKDRMFSIIAHDFRSPLNTIQGVLSLLHVDALSEEELRMLLPDLTRKVDASINLLDNLLHWSRAQMQGLRMEVDSFPLKKVITETAAQLHQIASQKDILIQVFASDETSVIADPEMIRLVIRNLLSNAIKFSHADHAIHVEVHEPSQASEKGYATVSVTDFGIGILPEVLPDLFDRQGYTTRGTAQEKGTGLGLSLCQEYVELNGGRIWVDSQEGHTTTFSFTVPLASVTQPVAVC